MNSDAMIDAGIHSGDVLIVDRSVKAVNGKDHRGGAQRRITGKKIANAYQRRYLVAENKKYGNIQVDEFSNYAAFVMSGELAVSCWLLAVGCWLLAVGKK
jgi:DNA polymerase V